MCVSIGVVGGRPTEVLLVQHPTAYFLPPHLHPFQVSLVCSAEIVCTSVIFYKIEVFGAGRMEGGIDGGKGNVTDRGVGEPPVFVGVKCRPVGADPLGGDFDVGVAAVIEGAVHLEAHFEFDAVVDYGGDLGHLLCVGGFFLDDGSDGEDFLPRFGIPCAEVFLCQCFVPFFTETRQHPHDPRFA